jgi:WD40 repeat protein
MSSRAGGDPMVKRNRLHGFGRVSAAWALAASLVLLSACSSDDKRPLVQIEVLLGAYAVPVETVAIAAAAGDIQLSQMSIPPNANGKYGLYLPDETSGTVTVYVSVLGGGGCVLATGSVAGVKVTPGETTKPVRVDLTPTGDLCLGDAAVPPDTAAPSAEVGADLSPSGVDSAGDATPSPVDSGRDAGADAWGPDAGSPEVVALDAGPGDVPVVDVDAAHPGEAGADRPGDASVGSDAADAPSLPDVQLDSAEAGTTTMNVFRNCASYTHSELTSQDAAADWGVRQVAFSPDGKYLVSVGEDARVKVWNVTATGLSPLASNLILDGGRQNPVGAFSPDGKYLAIGHGYDVTITVYDFQASVTEGAAVVKWTIPRALAPATAYSINQLQFTTDAGHLVAFYRGDTGDTNELVLWELATTSTIMKQVTYPNEEHVYAVVPDSYPGPVIVASAAVAQGDAGYQSTVTVTDVIAVPASEVQATVSGEIDQMVFAPDGSLIVGVVGSGEVSLWAVSGTTLVRQPLPLIPTSTAGGAGCYDLAVTRDGRYLAAAMDDYDSTSVKLVALAQDESTRTKTTEYLPWSVAFAPSGLALAIGERDDGIILYCTP